MSEFPTEMIPIDELKPHPKNYQEHPDDQLDHIIESISENGIYRNILIARDNTILAGHGVVKAAKKMGIEEIPVIRLNLDPDDPRALKVLIGDNEISHLAAVDDRLLSEILKEIRDSDTAGLLGTGYDEMMLANLVMVTRPRSEIQDFDEAKEWVGMPEYDEGGENLSIVINFRNPEDRQKFADDNELVFMKQGDLISWTCWVPPKTRDDIKSVKFQ